LSRFISLTDFLFQETDSEAGHQFLVALILATWEAEIRRMWFEASLGKKFHESPSQPITEHGDQCLSAQGT
jgi:hypothetical protein